MADALDPSKNDEAALAVETPDNAPTSREVVQAERTARKEQKRIDWRDWRPTENAAMLNEKIVIGHPVLRRLFDLVFIRGQIATYMLQSKTSRSAIEEDARQRVEEVIETTLQKVEKELAGERARLLEFAKGDGISEFPAKNYVVLEELNVCKFSPGASRLLRIFRGLDDIFWMLEVLFINGTIKLSHKINVTNRWKKLLWELVRTQTNTWVTMRNAMRDGGRIRRNHGDGEGEGKASSGSADADLSRAA